MAYQTEDKTAAQLQAEIEMQRGRVESTIDQIQEKLSPGQLVDELLAYTKGGGGEFVASLQRNVTANPLPVALLGVSLAWLMARPAGAERPDDTGTIRTDRHWDDSINHRRGYADGSGHVQFGHHEDYPVTVIGDAGLQRLGQSSDEHGNVFSEFADDSGRKFKALTDSTGKRAGHFIDESGNRFKGFTNAAGERIEHVRDEAGNVLDDVLGWASHTWKEAREHLHDARDSLGAQAGSGRHKAAQAGHALRGQVDSLNQTVLNQFRDQPLVGGALAFALGAALGSALPHTAKEDAVMGEASDKLKARAGEAASDAYDKGKDKASELYAAASEKADGVYQQARTGVNDALDSAGPTGGAH